MNFNCQCALTCNICISGQLLRLKMFREDHGSWMTMFFSTILFLFIFSHIYNTVLLMDGNMGWVMVCCTAPVCWGVVVKSQVSPTAFRCYKHGSRVLRGDREILRSCLGFSGVINMLLRLAQGFQVNMGRVMVWSTAPVCWGVVVKSQVSPRAFRCLL